MTGPTRRRVLALAAATGVAQALRATASPDEGASAPPLRAAPASVALADGAAPTPVWAFDGVTPGPELRGVLGDDLALPIENALSQPITVRVFGLRGQAARLAIPAGGRGVLRAAPSDAGTFWYAAEDRLADPRARGLAGAFIVEEPEEHAFDADRDLAIVLDAWPVGPDGRLTASPVAATAVANGRADLVEPAHPGERLRLRLINAARDRRLRVALDGWTGWVVALDGYPLAVVEPMETLDLWPGQRADIVVDAPTGFGATAALLDLTADATRALALFVADGEALDPLGYAPLPLTAPDRPPPGDLDQATRIGPEIFGPDGSPATVARGATLRLALPASQTDTVLTVEGTALRTLGGPSPGPLRDVVGLSAGEVAEVAFVAETAGDWTMTRRALDGSLDLRAILRVV